MGLLFSGSDFSLYFMAIHRPLDKITIPLSHLPTWFFIIGYPLFWLQLYSHTAGDGVTSALSWILFGSVTLVSLREAKPQSNFLKEIASSLKNTPRDDIKRLFWCTAFGIALFIVGIVVLAS